MLKKLKWKFIFINMAFVTAVLCIVFGALMASTYQRLKGESFAALQRALAQGYPERGVLEPEEEEDAREPAGAIQTAQGEDKGLKKEGLKRQPSISQIPTMAVLVLPNGNIEALYENRLALSEEELEEAVRCALAAEKHSGLLKGLEVRFFRRDVEEGTVIAFSERGNEVESMRQLIFSSLLVGTLGLGVFFALSFFLAGWVFHPVEESWVRQKQFIADASHELKTPLAVILANTDILLSHPEKQVGEQRKWLDYIRAEAGQMSALVSDMLFLAKSDAGREGPEFSNINLSDVMLSSLLSFEPVAFERGKELASRIEPGVTVRGDEAKCRRLAAILLDNAVKYAGEKGKVTVTLSTAQDKARFRVHNTGEAIPEKDLPHLFERFYRVDSSRSRESGGYGLGLAIAQEIMLQHAGRLLVSSGEGGTCFEALFPLA